MKYFEIQTKALRRIGVSIDGYKSTVYKIYSLFITCVFYIMFPVLSVAELFKIDSADDFYAVFLYATATLSGSFKALLLVTNRNKIGKVLSRLEERPFLPDQNRGGEEEEKLIKKCVWITNIQTYFYCGAGMTTIMAKFLYGVAMQIRNKNNNYREFLFGSFTPLDITSWFNYEICWTYQVCSLGFFAYFVSSLDLLISTVLVHVSYQYKILQNFLKQIVDTSYKLKIKDSDLHDSESDIDSSNISWKYLQKALKAAVSYHETIVDIASEIERVFNGFMLVMFLESIILMCISIYRAPTAFSGMRIIGQLAETFSIVCHVIFYCYWGEQVREESQKVGFAAYDAYRPGMDLRFQKALVAIIRKSQRPTAITAAGFADIGLSTFATILRMSYSAVMLMRNIATGN